MSGFIAMRRDALGHPLLKDGARFRAWFWLVSNAAWKATQFDIRGTLVPIQRGQLCVSVRQMADAWGMSKSAVDRFLTRLETETMIEREAGHGRLVITICNYAKYQDSGNGQGDTSGTPSGTPAGHQRDLKEQGNKETIIPNGMNTLTPARKNDDFPCPVWADPAVWLDLKRNRKTKRLTNTPTAHKRFVAAIEAMADDEWPPGRLLEEIVAKGWAGPHDPRDDRKPNNDNRHAKPSNRNTAELARRKLAGMPH